MIGHSAHGGCASSHWHLAHLWFARQIWRNAFGSESVHHAGAARCLWTMKSSCYKWTDGHVRRCFLFSIIRTMLICPRVIIGSRTFWRMKLILWKAFSPHPKRYSPRQHFPQFCFFEMCHLEVFAMVVSRELSVNEPSSANSCLENDTQFCSIFFWDMYLEMWFISSWSLRWLAGIFFTRPTWAEALIILVNCLVQHLVTTPIFWAGSFLIHWKAMASGFFPAHKETYLGPKETYLRGFFSGVGKVQGFCWSVSNSNLGIFPTFCGPKCAESEFRRQRPLCWLSTQKREMGEVRVFRLVFVLVKDLYI